MKRSVIVAASVLLASMSARAETVEVSRLDATTLQVNLSGVESARTLWLAMDSSDKGDDVASWSHWCRVSDLPARKIQSPYQRPYCHRAVDEAFQPYREHGSFLNSHISRPSFPGKVAEEPHLYVPTGSRLL